MPKLSASDKAHVTQSVKHARLVEASRKLARIVKHTDPTAAVKKKRTALERNLSAWLRHHGGEAFDCKWGQDHRTALAKINKAISKGGMFALAMPRGHGKTTILKWVALYVMLTGKRKYVVVVAATQDMAQDILEFCKLQIIESDTLFAHYPHVCAYARATNNKAIKANQQLRSDGKSSGIKWSKKTLVLPESLSPEKKPYKSNGSILQGDGLTGAIRGKWKDSKTGKTLRPDFVILDDPQTRESAESESQCNMRERTITGDVMGLAGPRKRIAAVMPCTVIRPGDLASRFLDHKLHPEWQGETSQLVNAWPKEQDGLWVEYSQIYQDAVSEGRGFGEATAFYRKNRRAMDKGSKVSWKERVRDGEISALQTAENLLLETGDQFWAEYQNDPVDLVAISAPYEITPELVMARTTDRKPLIVPDWVHAIHASTDVNPSYALSTVIIGMGLDQTCAVLWYGLHKCNVKDDLPKPEFDKRLYAEIIAHGKELAAMPVSPETWAIDGGGKNFDAVIRAAAESARACGIPAAAYTGRGWKHYRESGKTYQKGQPQREYCNIRSTVKDGRKIRWIVWHADYWREIAQRSWLGDPGAPGACTLPAGKHREFGAQICGDKLQGKDEVGGEMVWNWHTVPGKHDFGDALAQAYALAAYGGIGTGGQVKITTGRKKYTQKDLRR